MLRARRPRATSAAAPRPKSTTIGGAGTGCGSPLDVEPPDELLPLVEELPLVDELVDELPLVELLPLVDVLDETPLLVLVEDEMPDDVLLDEPPVDVDVEEPPVEVDVEEPPVDVDDPPVEVDDPPVDVDDPPVDVEDPPVVEEMPPVVVDDELPPDPPLDVEEELPPDPPLDVEVDPLVVEVTTTLPPLPPEPPKKPPAKKPPPKPANPPDPPITTGTAPPPPPANAISRGSIGGSGIGAPRVVVVVTIGSGYDSLLATTRRTRLTRLHPGPTPLRHTAATRTDARFLIFWTCAGRAIGWPATCTAAPPMSAPPHAQAASFARAIFTDIASSCSSTPPCLHEYIGQSAFSDMDDCGERLCSASRFAPISGLLKAISQAARQRERLMYHLGAI